MFVEIHNFFSESAEKEATTILGLNDDCLREVFEHLDPYDLGSIADVCHRFRHASTEDHFAHRKFVSLEFHSRQISPQMLQRLPNLLRNFSRFIEYIMVDELGESHKFIKLLGRYCSETLKSYSIKNLYSIEIAVHLSMFRNIRKLKLYKVDPFDQLILEMLPFWCPELNELTLESVGERPALTGLRRNFPKLERFLLHSCFDVMDDEIEHFVQRNPQLTHVYITKCRCLTESSLQSIVKYAPQIEKLHFNWENSFFRTETNFQIRVNSSQLSKLKSLLMGPVKDAIPVLHHIVTRNIPIENLLLFRGYESDLDPLIQTICHMKTLKSLSIRYELGVRNTTHIPRIGKHLPELTHLDLNFSGFLVNAENLLELIRVSNKLQVLCYEDRDDIAEICTNVGTFMKMVKLIEKRPTKTPLKILLNAGERSIDIPAELLHKYKYILTIVVDKHEEEIDKVYWQWSM